MTPSRGLKKPSGPDSFSTPGKVISAAPVQHSANPTPRSIENCQELAGLTQKWSVLGPYIHIPGKVTTKIQTGAWPLQYQAAANSAI